MITNSFDPISPPIVTPKQTIKPEEFAAAKDCPADCFLLFFSKQLFDLLLETGEIETMPCGIRMHSACAVHPICRIPGTKIGAVLLLCGAPVAAAMIEELHTLFGCKHFIVFGSCGALTEIPPGNVILPSAAVRDEGTSYHYLQPSEEIAVRNSSRLAAFFARSGIPYVQGKIWTTDAFYRETENNTAKRIAAGCICVDMECSALEAVCDAIGAQLYQFVYAADSLVGSWSRRILGSSEKDFRLRYFALAKTVAEAILDGSFPNG